MYVYSDQRVQNWRAAQSTARKYTSVWFDSLKLKNLIISWAANKYQRRSLVIIHSCTSVPIMSTTKGLKECRAVHRDSFCQELVRIIIFFWLVPVDFNIPILCSNLHFNCANAQYTANVLTIKTKGTGNCGVPAGKICTIYGKGL